MEPEAVPQGAPTSVQTPTIPVARRGLVVLGALLAVVIAAGTLYNGADVGYGRGLVKTLGNLGFRSPAIAAYTLLLLSPLFFETAYPRLRERFAPQSRAANVVENLHVSAPYLIAIGIVMLVMRIENIFDLAITSAIGWDFTPAIYRIEGGLVERIQAAMRHPALDIFFSFVYVVLYSLYHVVAMGYFAATGRTRMLKRFLVTWVLIYAVALPFYLFFPVNEVWTTDPRCGVYDYGEVEGVLHDDCTAQGGIVYAISSINNSFPSLHNAFAWALPMLFWRSGWRRAAVAVSGVAALVTVSTVYLGIHWILDIVAGVALAWFATAVAARAEFTVTPDLWLRGWRWSAPTEVPLSERTPLRPGRW